MTVVQTELERAIAIAQFVLPGHDPHHSCMLVAAAVIGMRGLRLSDLRVGAIFWPKKFADQPYLGLRGGWGCEGFADGRVYLSDTSVDDDGGFAGHTWVETDQHGVIDLMHDADGWEPEVRATDGRVETKWIRRRQLENGVRQYWRDQIRQAVRIGRKQGVLV